MEKYTESPNSSRDSTGFPNWNPFGSGLDILKDWLLRQALPHQSRHLRSVKQSLSGEWQPFLDGSLWWIGLLNMLIIVYSLFIPEWMMMISSTFDTISKQQWFKTLLKSQVIWKSAIKFSNRCTVTCILLRGCYNFQSQSGKVTLTPLEKTSTDWAKKQLWWLAQIPRRKARNSQGWAKPSAKPSDLRWFPQHETCGSEEVPGPII